MSKTILIAEDAPMLREMLALELREHGLAVELAKDGKEAITAIKKKKPALLLLDLVMPRVDGFAVLQYMHQKGCTFPVVILSNLSDPQEEQRCRDLGAKDFLIKSQFDAGELWRKIEQYVE